MGKCTCSKNVHVRSKRRAANLDHEAKLLLCQTTAGNQTATMQPATDENRWIEIIASRYLLTFETSTAASMRPKVFSSTRRRWPRPSDNMQQYLYCAELRPFVFLHPWCRRACKAAIDWTVWVFTICTCTLRCGTVGYDTERYSACKSALQTVSQYLVICLHTHERVGPQPAMIQLSGRWQNPTYFYIWTSCMLWWVL